MNLRTLSITSTASIGVIAVLVATSLGVGTTYIDQQARSLSSSVTRVRAIEDLEVNLLLHNRESMLFDLGRGEAHAMARDAAERELMLWQEELRRSNEGARSAELLRLAGLQIEAYLEARRRAVENGLLVMRVYTSTTDELDLAFGTLEQLLEVELAEARMARARAELWNRMADVASVGAVVLLIGISLLVLWLARRQVYLPLVALRGAIRRYGKGEQAARAKAEGVEELRDIAAVFNEMADALVQQRRQQLGVLASVAHDLRNPLAALQFSVAMVRPDRPLPPEERVRKLFARVGQQVTRCDRMLGDL
ncbi:MAG TPA: histidine kinase dimerization/phospho-acceptor domain-containing protein, partial [Candidatus Nanopelagicales bacterium]|nr:histidine kinase dimerization/phospho-acceptor domain-containing protein [Candidatus Nanopelagicales bacterium]